MAFVNLTSQTWGSGPKITLTPSYEKKRDGANMLYRIKMTVGTITGSSYFGYPIYMKTSLDGTLKDTHTLKSASPSQWSSEIVYTTDWLTVSNKTTGTVSLKLQVYSGSGSSRDSTYSYSLPIDPAASVLGSISNFTISSGVTIPITKYSSSFTDTLTISVGGSTVKTVSGITNGTKVTFTTSELTTIYNKLSGSKSGTFTFKLTTTSGSTTVGTSSKTATGTIPTATLGTISNFTIGNNISIPISNTHSSLKYYLGVYINGTLITLRSGVTNGYTLTFTANEVNTIFGALSNKANGTFTFQLDTYSGSALVGSSPSKTATGTIPTATISGAWDFTMTDGITVQISNYYSSLSYVFEAFLNGTRIKSANVKTNPHTFNYADELNTIYGLLPNSTSGTFTYKLTTKNGSATVGTSSKTVTGTIPTSIKPSISSVIINEGNTDVVPSSWGVFVKSKSKLNIITTASGGIGASISDVKVTIDGTTVYNGSDITTNTINLSGTRRISVKVTDSRGRYTSLDTTATVVDYEVPYITTLNAFRCDSNGNATDKGNNLYIGLKGGIYSVKGKNTPFSYKVQYKKSNDDSFQEYTFDVANSEIDSYIIINNIDSVSTYVVKGIVTDYFTSYSRTAPPVPSVFRTLNFKPGGRGVGVGKMAEEDELLDIALQTKFTGGFKSVTLEPGTDLNYVFTPNFYEGEDIAENGYTHCPISSGCFSLEVFSQGKDRYKQRFSWSYKSTYSEVYERYYYSGSWGSWLPVSFKATSLYSNSNGTTGTITLSQSYANFNFLHIVFGNGFAHYTTVLESKYFSTAKLDFSDISATNKTGYIASKLLTFSSKTVTQSTSKGTLIYNNGSLNLSDGDYIYVYRIVGYK